MVNKKLKHHESAESIMINKPSKQKKVRQNAYDKKLHDLNMEPLRLNDDMQKKLVYGYIRNCQQLLPKQKLYFNIPTSLHDIC